LRPSRDISNGERRVSDGRPQRGSIFTGLLLVLLGALFLLQRFDPQLGVGHILQRYWPVLLIVWGAAKLIDHFATGKSGEERPPLLTGSEAALLALLVVVLAGMAALEWLPRFRPGWAAKTDMFQTQAEQSESLPPVVLPPGSHVRISIATGSITVHGVSGNELRVSADEQAGGSSEKAAQARLGGVSLQVDHDGLNYVIRPAGQGSGDPLVRLNLDVQVPAEIPIAVQTELGSVRVSGTSGGVIAQTASGDVDVHECEGEISATVANGDAHVSDIKGNVTLNGRGDDVDVNDISGNATLAGSFMGTVVVRNVAGNVEYAETRTNLVLAKLTGRMEADPESLKISDVNGPLRVATKDKDVEIENVSGPLDVSNTHGDVGVRYDQAPEKPINIANGTGDVTLSLPAGAGFEISAVAASGDVASDFAGAGLHLENGEQSGKLAGTVGQGGPRITVATSYGTIQLRKSS